MLGPHTGRVSGLNMPNTRLWGLHGGEMRSANGKNHGWGTDVIGLKALVVLLLAIAPAALGQTFYGSVLGSVSDPSGAVM